MSLPLLRPGQTHRLVPKLKEAVVRELLERDHADLGASIRIDYRTYGPHAVTGVKQFQRDLGLLTDGIVGRRTWAALGFDEPVVDVHPVLNGVPWERGVIALHGRWVAPPPARKVVEQKRLGRWRGSVYSGYRPDWYQKILFDRAVKKYGSREKASHWVAPPGRSHHRYKDERGAVDVHRGWELDAASAELYRPMSWESWHVELVGSRDQGIAPPDNLDEIEMPDVPEPGEHGMPTVEELANAGVAAEDVDAAVDALLDQMDAADTAGDESDAEAGVDPDASDELFDPENREPG